MSQNILVSAAAYESSMGVTVPFGVVLWFNGQILALKKKKTDTFGSFG